MSNHILKPIRAHAFAGSIAILTGVAASLLAGNALAQQEIDPQQVLGAESCRECHQASIERWQQTAHAKVALQELTANPKAQQFAKAMGVGDITSASLCTQCHGTQQATSTGAVQVAMGVSCESCHGAAGPKDGGWYTIHSKYGDGLIGIEHRDKETETHRQLRLTKAHEAGMNGVEHAYELVKNCYQCHSVPNEKLVNQAGHPGLNSGFEFVNWFQGEVRHNYQLNPKVNADAPTLWTDDRWGKGGDAQDWRRVMYVLGQLVELETMLRNRASATKPGGFATTAAGRVAAANGKLNAMNGRLQAPEITQATQAVTPILGQLFAPPNPQSSEVIDAAADTVAEAAKRFAKRDGSELSAIDPQVPSEGRVHQQ